MEFSLNDIDAAAYGLTFKKGTYAALRKPAKRKAGVENNWPDQHGTERENAPIFYDTRSITIPVLLEGTNELDAALKFQALKENVFDPGYFNFKAHALNRQFTFIYDDITDFQEFGSCLTFNLIVLDDFPHLKTAIV